MKGFERFFTKRYFARGTTKKPAITKNRKNPANQMMIVLSFGITLLSYGIDR